MASNGYDEAWIRQYCAKHGLPLPKELQQKPAQLDKPQRATSLKYRNKPTERHGKKFPSIHEADVYDELLLRLRAGELLAVMCQVPFVLPGGVVYKADFVILHPNYRYEVLDAKSPGTAKDKVYRIKKRQMRECLGIEIQEV